MKVIDMPGYDTYMLKLGHSELECDTNAIGNFQNGPNQDEDAIAADDGGHAVAGAAARAVLRRVAGVREAEGGGVPGFATKDELWR